MKSLLYIDKDMNPDCYRDSAVSTSRATVPTNARMAVTAVPLGDDKVKVAMSSQDGQYDIIPEYTNKIMDCPLVTKHCKVLNHFLFKPEYLADVYR